MAPVTAYTAITAGSTGGSPYCFRTVALPLKQVPAGDTAGEASAPREFKMAYVSDESRRRLLWEQEAPSSSLGAPTTPLD